MIRPAAVILSLLVPALSGCTPQYPEETSPPPSSAQPVSAPVAETVAGDAGTDCECTRTGNYVGAAAPIMTATGDRRMEGRSPQGTYRVTVELMGDERVALKILDAASAVIRYETEYQFEPSRREGDAFGIREWGFSPQDERSFGYLVANGRVEDRLEIVNLRTGEAVHGDMLHVRTGEWAFSPCGDVAARIQSQYSEDDRTLELIRTRDGVELARLPGSDRGDLPLRPGFTLASTRDAHVITTETNTWRGVEQHSSPLAPNTAPRRCERT